jgi:sulfopyruvate decarboxylase alpha subunit
MSTNWPEEMYGLLREAGIDQFAFVPDAGHDFLIKRSIADPDVHAIALTTEEEGVGLLAGAHLGGSRGVLLMQSSGVGNCINLLSLIRAGRFPFLTLVTMRGDFGEGNPWQMPMGQSTQPVLEACDVICMRIDDPAEVESTISAAITMAFNSEIPIAVLLGQKLLGAKKFS